MTQIRIPSLLRAGLAACAFLAAAVLHAASVGQPAPAFTLTDIEGKTHSLSDFRGKTVVLEWVNQECPFVVKHYQSSGNLPATQKAAVEDGVVWLLINSAAPGNQGDYDAEKVKAWMEKNKVAATAYLRD
jgi:glutathione peroxidase-family protein